jgi:hypothetical protein
MISPFVPESLFGVQDGVEEGFVLVDAFGSYLLVENGINL